MGAEVAQELLADERIRIGAEIFNAGSAIIDWPRRKQVGAALERPHGTSHGRGGLPPQLARLRNVDRGREQRERGCESEHLRKRPAHGVTPGVRLAMRRAYQ